MGMRLLVAAALWLCVVSSAWSTGAAAKTILVHGDSLSAAYGLAREQGWVDQLGRALQQEGHGWRVVNASMSGETTAGGMARLPGDLKTHAPNIVILALGANDGLRGLGPADMQRNLREMIRASQAAGAKVLLIGMRLPPNYGPGYARAFEAVFSDLARDEHTALLPFLLEPIASDRSAFQADQLHPTAAAQPMLLAHVRAALDPLLTP